MDFSRSDGATAPCPSFFDLFSKPRGRSRQLPLPLPPRLPLFDWAEVQRGSTPKKDDKAENDALDRGDDNANTV
jgi:hypothetical protein